MSCYIIILRTSYTTSNWILVINVFRHNYLTPLTCFFVFTQTQTLRILILLFLFRWHWCWWLILEKVNNRHFEHNHVQLTEIYFKRCYKFFLTSEMLGIILCTTQNNAKSSKFAAIFKAVYFCCSKKISLFTVLFAAVSGVCGVFPQNSDVTQA